MRAAVVDQGAPGRVGLAEVDPPSPGPGELLVEVEAVSLNPFELPREGSAPGAVLGWDAAGVVRELGEGCDGPPVGSRVLSWAPSGGWAELRAASAVNCAVIPEGVSPAAAATLPVAGVTALRALRDAGSLIGQRLLLIGAAGAVGTFAAQLARLGGAEVVGVVSSGERAASIAEGGLDEVLVGLDGLEGTFSAVIDCAGGDAIARAFPLLEERGTYVSVGAGSGKPSTLPPYALVSGNRKLIAFQRGGEVGRDLSLLLRLVSLGRLEPVVGRSFPWAELPEAVATLQRHEVVGKVVVEL